MVRARLTAIDGQPVRASDAVKDSNAPTAVSRTGQARRLRTRRYNLTYRPALSTSEKLVEGRHFTAGEFQPQEAGGAKGALPELSLEVDFARSLGVGVGSRLTFDVQGVPVEGRVVNLREVRWNSFQPNFFVLFQSGILEDAPQIYLASVPRMPDAEREALQASIVERFRNVSVIDVTRSVKRLLALLSQLQWALTSTATLSLAVGLVLIFAIARDQARARRWEINLLKVLGADFAQIRSMLDIEFGVLGLMATAAGIGCSCLASAVLSTVVLEATWSPAWEPMLFTGVAIPIICVATARIAARGVLRERPLALLQSAEP
jgi:putative ABC transport system permease protein